MPDPKTPVPCSWLTLALTLLTLALIVPARMTRGAPDAAPGVAHRYDLAPPIAPPTVELAATPPTSSDLQLTDLTAENEEQDRVDACDEIRTPFLIPCSFRKVAEHRFGVLRSTPSLYPLRC